MKESYITKNFKKTAAARFPAQAEQLNAAFYARLQAHRHDEMPVPRRQHVLRLSGAVPLLLRQRRYNIRRPAPQALLAPHKDAGTRERLL